MKKTIAVVFCMMFCLAASAASAGGSPADDDDWTVVLEKDTGPLAEKFKQCESLQKSYDQCMDELGECNAKLGVCTDDLVKANKELAECQGYLAKLPAECWIKPPPPSLSGISKYNSTTKKTTVTDGSKVKVKKQCDVVCQCRKPKLNGYWLDDASLPFHIMAKYGNRCLTLEEVHEFAWALTDYLDELKNQVDMNAMDIQAHKDAIKLLLKRLDDLADRLEELELEVDALRDELDQFRKEFEEWKEEVEARLAALEEKNAEQDEVLEDHEKRLTILEEWMKIQVKNGRLVYGMSPLSQVHGRLFCTFYGQCWAGPMTGVDFEVNFDKAALRFAADGGFLFGVSRDENMGYMFNVGGLVFPYLGSEARKILGLGLSFTYLRGGTEEDWLPGDSSPEHKIYAGTFDVVVQYEGYFGKDEDSHLAGAWNVFLGGSIGAGAQTFLAEDHDTGQQQAVRGSAVGVWMLQAGFKVRFMWRSK